MGNSIYLMSNCNRIDINNKITYIRNMILVTILTRATQASFFSLICHHPKNPALEVYLGAIAL